MKIVFTPEVCGGAARIAGTRIRVADIVRMFKLGYTKEEIAEWYSITLDDVNEALRYYKEHPEEVDRIIKEEEKIVEAIKYVCS